MAKDKLTVIYGIIYTSLIVVIWIFLFVIGVCDSYYHDYILFYLMSPGGMFTFLGALFLVPSFIFNMVFFLSDEGNTS